MGAWIDQNPEAFLTIVVLLIAFVTYIVRMEGKVSRIDERVTACEDRADEDRKEIKDHLKSISGEMGAVKSAVDQIVGALHGRRAGDFHDVERT
jgi:hypothetical protein